ncbi:MAG TPA: hypothetical protein VG013_06325 [Gemmataceae bacterium]|nr:hypothetical protein [Gemmataceae bacterium]
MERFRDYVSLLARPQLAPRLQGKLAEVGEQMGRMREAVAGLVLRGSKRLRQRLTPTVWTAKTA